MGSSQAQRMPSAARQAISLADVLALVVCLAVPLRAAVEVADDEPVAHGLHAPERLLQRARYRNRSLRAALGVVVTPLHICWFTVIVGYAGAVAATAALACVAMLA